jgi:urease alpha subunit
MSFMIIIGLNAILPNIRLTQPLPMVLSHEIGSVEVGKLADLVLWKPAFFGCKTFHDY